jgi:hypothetical protein
MKLVHTNAELDQLVANARDILAPSVRSAVERALADGHQPLDSTDLQKSFERFSEDLQTTACICVFDML